MLFCAIGTGQVIVSFPWVRPSEVDTAIQQDSDRKPIRLADRIAVPHSDHKFEGPRSKLRGIVLCPGPSFRA